MQAALDQFRANIQRVRNLSSLHTYFSSVTTPALDLSDILRTQIVMIVSALDHYIHELTRLGMIEILENRRPQTPAFLRFQVSLEAALTGMVPASGSGWLDTEVRTRHGYLAFQQADKVADAMRLISTVELWPELSRRLMVPVRDLKNQLHLIVDRRNKIAHEADLDPSFPRTYWPITTVDVGSSTDFIERLCETIHVIVVSQVLKTPAPPQ